MRGFSEGGELGLSRNVTLSDCFGFGDGVGVVGFVSGGDIEDGRGRV